MKESQLRGIQGVMSNGVIPTFILQYPLPLGITHLCADAPHLLAPSAYNTCLSYYLYYIYKDSALTLPLAILDTQKKVKIDRRLLNLVLFETAQMKALLMF